MIKSLLVLSVLLSLSVALAQAAPQSAKIEIDTMVCGPDPHMIKAALIAVKGVATVEVSLETKTAIVTFDNAQTNLNALMAAVASTGHASLPALPNL